MSTRVKSCRCFAVMGPRSGLARCVATPFFSLRYLAWIFAVSASLWSTFNPAKVFASVAGEVVFSVGNAQVLPRDLQLQRGLSLYEGDVIVTDAGAHVHVRFSDGALLSVRPNSRLTIERYRYQPGLLGENAVKFRLENGTARSITGKAGEESKHRFRLNTPVAAIGVRGTDFVVATDTASSSVAVNSGVIVVSPIGGGCSRDALGPCSGDLAKELSASMPGILARVEAGRVEFMTTRELPKGRIAPPAESEPKSVVSAPPAPSSATQTVSTASGGATGSVVASAPSSAVAPSSPVSIAANSPSVISTSSASPAAVAAPAPTTVASPIPASPAVSTATSVSNVASMMLLPHTAMTQTTNQQEGIDVRRFDSVTTGVIGQIVQTTEARAKSQTTTSDKILTPVDITPDKMPAPVDTAQQEAALLASREEAKRAALNPSILTWGRWANVSTLGDKDPVAVIQNPDYTRLVISDGIHALFGPQGSRWSGAREGLFDFTLRDAKVYVKDPAGVISMGTVSTGTLTIDLAAASFKTQLVGAHQQVQGPIEVNAKGYVLDDGSFRSSLVSPANLTGVMANGGREAAYAFNRPVTLVGGSNGSFAGLTRWGR